MFLPIKIDKYFYICENRYPPTMHTFLDSVTVEEFTWKRKGDTVYFAGRDGVSYLLLRGSKAHVGRPITRDISFMWLYYGDKSNPRRDAMYRTLDRFIQILKRKIFKDATVHPFYQSNGMCVSVQRSQGLVLDIFTATGKQVSIDDDYVSDAKQFYTHPLVWFESAVFKSDRWYVNVKLVQLVIYPQVITLGKCLLAVGKCLLPVGDTEETYARVEVSDTTGSTCTQPSDNRMMRTVTYAEHPTYRKYFKMISLGIPTEAVRIKITSELGETHAHVLGKRPSDTCVIEQVEVSKHPSYEKYFKMCLMGIPRQAVQQKMELDGISDASQMLNDPSRIVDNLPSCRSSSSLVAMFEKIRLKSVTSATPPKITIQTNDPPRISLDELFKKRGEIMRKKDSF